MNSIIQHMQQLIALPSVSSVNPSFDQSNHGVILQLEDWFSSAGFKTEVMPIPGEVGKYNLIATLGEGADGLVLAGHTDTVPYDDARWKSDPFSLTERDGRLHGLGTCDMKGFFAVILEAVKDLTVQDLKHPLVVLATANEESSMSGAKALVNSGRRLGRYAVVGEPTSLTPIRMHKGILMEAIQVRGQSGHSSNPALGNNAMEGMHKVMGRILEWRLELQAKHRNPAFEVEVPTLNLGHIHGGDNPNRICAETELHIDLRPLPGMQLDQLREELHQTLRHELQDSGLSIDFKALFDGIPAMETQSQSEIVRITEQLTGHQAQSVAFGTEAPFFNAMDMETVVLGPGSIDQAHQPDEFMALEQIPKGVELLKGLIGHFCR